MGRRRSLVRAGHLLSSCRTTGVQLRHISPSSSSFSSGVPASTVDDQLPPSGHHMASPLISSSSSLLDYDLPASRIALRPCSPRDSSRLLLCDHEGEGGRRRLHDLRFRDVEGLLPSGTLVVLNHSRVITARVPMAKQETGGAVEVLCISPLEPSHDPALALRATSGQAVWRCMVGGKRVKPGMKLIAKRPSSSTPGMVEGLNLRAVVESRDGRDGILRFWWDDEGGVSSSSEFGEVLEQFGRVPLPPYMHRPDDESDKEAYNTVYAKQEGSVAAPTAGLHFTPELMSRLQQHRQVDFCRLTLHVGAGTFQPVESDEVTDHRMHWERFYVEARALDQLINAVESGHPIVPCGTTSGEGLMLPKIVRTLESVYWAGAGLLLKKGGGGSSSGRGGSSSGRDLRVAQWDPYELEQIASAVPAAEALGAVRRYMHEGGLEAVGGETQLMIMPGYRFALCDGLITNFHQPRSTLLLLVGAVLGGLDAVHDVYCHALQQQQAVDPYRFLSFGDSSLLVLPPHTRRRGIREPSEGLQLLPISTDQE